MSSSPSDSKDSLVFSTPLFPKLVKEGMVHITLGEYAKTKDPDKLFPLSCDGQPLTVEMTDPSHWLWDFTTAAQCNTEMTHAWQSSGCIQCGAQGLDHTLDCFIQNMGCPNTQLPPNFRDYNKLLHRVHRNGLLKAWPNGLGDKVVPGTDKTFEELVPYDAMFCMAALSHQYGARPTAIDEALVYAQTRNLVDAKGVSKYGPGVAPWYGDTAEPGSSLTWANAKADEQFADLLQQPLVNWLGRLPRQYWTMDRRICRRACSFFSSHRALGYLAIFYQHAVQGKVPSAALIKRFVWELYFVDRFLQTLTMALFGKYTDEMTFVPDPKFWPHESQVATFFAAREDQMSLWRDGYCVPHAPVLSTVVDRFFSLNLPLLDYVLRFRQRTLCEKTKMAWEGLVNTHRGKIGKLAKKAKIKMGGYTDSASKEDDGKVRTLTATQFVAVEAQLQVHTQVQTKIKRRWEVHIRDHANLRLQIQALRRKLPTTQEERRAIREEIETLEQQMKELKSACAQTKKRITKMVTTGTHMAHRLTTATNISPTKRMRK